MHERDRGEITDTPGGARALLRFLEFSKISKLYKNQYTGVLRHVIIKKKDP